MTSSMIDNDIKNLEYQTLKLPYEMLNKKFRQTQKNIDREVMKIQASVKEFERLMEKEKDWIKDEVEMEGVVEDDKMLVEDDKKGDEKMMVKDDKKGDDKMVVEDDKKGDDKMVVEGKINTEIGKEGVKEMMQKNSEKLMAFSKKLLTSMKEETTAGKMCKSGLEELKSCCDSVSDGSSLKKWKRKQLNKMIVEYFLRSGYYKSAVELAEASDIESLSNLNSFLLSRDIEAALDRKDTKTCLTWCADNKSKLKKIKSPLEMALRQQEFVELVRVGEKLQAVSYASRHLTTMEDPQYKDIQKCMVLLIFPQSSSFSPYKHLLDEERWTDLKSLFRRECYRMFQLNEAAILCLILQAGLSSLKTPICFESSDKFILESERPRKTKCPVCLPAFKSLSNRLPYALFSHSRLICFGSGEPMNEHNLPLMLPNGYAYGYNYLHEMSEKNQGQVTCPRTNQVFAFKDALKVFIM